MNFSLGNFFDKVFDNFKKITPTLIAVEFFTGFLLFLPPKILAALNLDNLPSSVNRTLGIIFLFCITLIIVIICLSFFRCIKAIVIAKVFKKKKLKEIDTLSDNQQEIIVELLSSPYKKIALDPLSGDTQFLVNKRYIRLLDQPFTLGYNNEIRLTYVPELWLLEAYNEELSKKQRGATHDQL